MCVGKHAYVFVSLWHDFSLVSQTGHGHRIPISIKREKENRFACLCASKIITDHLTLVHFDTVVLLTICTSVCLHVKREVNWQTGQKLESQRTAPA